MEIFNTLKQNITTVQNIKDGTSASSAPTTAQTQNAANDQADRQEQQKNIDELKKKLSDVTNQLNQQMAMMNTSIRFGFNDKIDTMYVNVVDTKTDKVIRKIPTDEMMTLQEAMRDMIGVIFNKKA